MDRRGVSRQVSKRYVSVVLEKTNTLRGACVDLKLLYIDFPCSGSESYTGLRRHSTSNSSTNITIIFNLGCTASLFTSITFALLIHLLGIVFSLH